MTLRAFVDVWIYATSSLAIVENVVLLYLVEKHTSSPMRHYSFILKQNCAFELFMTFLNIVFKSQTDYKDGKFFLMMHGPLSQSPPMTVSLCTSIWATSLFLCVTTIPVQFLYRHKLLSKEQMPMWLYSLYTGIGIAASVGFGVGCIFVYRPDEHFMRTYGKLLAEDPFYVHPLPTFIGCEIGLPLILLFVYCYILIFVTYAIICTTSYKIYKHFRTIDYAKAIKNHNLSRQVSAAFFVQIILPTVFFLVPLGVACTLTFLRVRIDGVGTIIILILAFMPVVRPFTTILIIRNYRNALFGFLGGNFSKVSVTNQQNINAASTTVVPRNRPTKPRRGKVSSVC